MQTVQTKDGKAKQVVVLSTKLANKANKPAKSQSNSVLKYHNSTHRNKGADAVYATTAAKFYRGDLARYAIGKYHALVKAKKGKPASAVAHVRRAKAAATKTA